MQQTAWGHQGPVKSAAKPRLGSVALLETLASLRAYGRGKLIAHRQGNKYKIGL
jgi:hypothetical protein